MFPFNYNLSLLRGSYEDSPDSLVEWAKTFPERIQSRVLRHAGKKAADTIAKRVKVHIPRSRRKHPQSENFRPWHTQDVVSFRHRIYRKNNLTYFVIGYESGMAPLQHLLEKGNWLTRPRMINHESNSGRVRVSRGDIRRRRIVKTSSGRVRTIFETVSKSTKVSTGSYRYRGNKTGRDESRGNFPRNGKPYAPLASALQDLGPRIPRLIEDEIRRGLTRANTVK